MEIERVSELSRDTFVEKYLAARVPIIITRAMEKWDLERFTPTALVEEFGEKEVQVYDSLFALQGLSTLGAYVAAQLNKPKDAPPSSEYVRWYTKLKDVDFMWSDAAFGRLRDAWDIPDFFPSSSMLIPFCPPGSQINPAESRFPYKGLFVSGRGARTRLHRDPWNSDALLCQLYGKKQIFIYGPDQTDFVMSGEDFVDTAHPDLERFPRFPEARPQYATTLAPGEIILFPGGSFHDVICSSDSVSITWNFVHACNARAFCTHVLQNPGERELQIVRFFLNNWLGRGASAQDIVDFTRRRYPSHF